MREQEAAQLAPPSVQKEKAQVPPNRMTENHVAVAVNKLVPFADFLRLRHNMQADRQNILHIPLDRRRRIRSLSPRHRLATTPTLRTILRRQRQNAHPLQFLQYPQRSLNPIVALCRKPAKLLADRVRKLRRLRPGNDNTVSCTAASCRRVKRLPTNVVDFNAVIRESMANSGRLLSSHSLSPTQPGVNPRPAHTRNRNQSHQSISCKSAINRGAWLPPKQMPSCGGRRRPGTGIAPELLGARNS